MLKIFKILKVNKTSVASTCNNYAVVFFVASFPKVKQQSKEPPSLFYSIV